LSSQLEIMAAQVVLNQAGVDGAKAITGTASVEAASGKYFCTLQAMTASVVAAQTDVDGAVNADLTAITEIPTGVLINGKWRAITLTSGELIGYYAKG
jgi:hypothetical protein